MTAPSTVSTHTDRAHLRLGLGRALLRLAYICLSSLRNEALSDHFRLTARRVLVALLLLLLLMLSALWNHLGFMLDDLLVPAWRLTEVTAPLVIVGNARSGTSTLHRLVCLDARLSSLRTWEILFGLSVTFHRLVCAAYDLDQRLGGRVTSLIAALERATWGRCSLHPLGLCEFEEDEWLFLTQGLSQLLLLPFPLATDALAPLIYFDELPEESRMCLFAFYRTCVQRHLYARTLRLGFAPRFVCKNPTFTLRLGSLLQAFPDALVMCAVRSPVQSVPSMVSYIGAAWHLFAAPVDAHPNVHQLLEFCFAHYLYPLEMLRSGRLPAAQLAFVSYEALVLDHRAVVMDALARLGVPTHPDTEAALQGAARKAEGYRSSHEYSLRDTCGISDGELRLLFAEVYAAHPLLREEADPAPEESSAAPEPPPPLDKGSQRDCGVEGVEWEAVAGAAYLCAIPLLVLLVAALLLKGASSAGAR